MWGRKRRTQQAEEDPSSPDRAPNGPISHPLVPGRPGEREKAAGSDERSEERRASSDEGSLQEKI